MTLEEATVALKHGLPVVIKNTDLGLEQGSYSVTSITKSIHKYEHHFSYSAGVSQNGRCIYHLPIHHLEAHPDYTSAYEMFIEELYEQNLKYDIAILLDKGGNKTTICKTVRELIDKIKKANA